MLTTRILSSRTSTLSCHLRRVAVHHGRINFFHLPQPKPFESCRRTMVTSKQRRKLLKKGTIKARGSGTLRNMEQEQIKKAVKREESNTSARQFILMVGIVPIVLTGAVVAVREDLQKDINQKWNDFREKL